MLRQLMTILGCSCLCLLQFITPTIAATTSVQGTVEFKPFSVEGFTVGIDFRVDANYADANKISVPAPFSTLIPKSEDFRTLVVHAPKPGNAFTKFNFVSPDRKTLLENLQFVPMTLPLIEVEKRLQIAANIIGKDGVRMATAGKQGAKQDVLRKTKIGIYDAVEVIGSYSDPGLGRMFYRMVAILNPASPNCVMALANVVEKAVKVPTLNDMVKTRSGVAIQRFKYIKQ